jgi:hypothetical protein
VVDELSEERRAGGVRRVSGLFTLSAGSTINWTGPAPRSSLASMIPPGAPTSRSAAITLSLGWANDGRSGNIRPKFSGLLAGACWATAVVGATTNAVPDAPAATAPAPMPRTPRANSRRLSWCLLSSCLCLATGASPSRTVKSVLLRRARALASAAAFSPVWPRQTAGAPRDRLNITPSSTEANRFPSRFGTGQ